jgi:hypothetical protein
MEPRELACYASDMYGRVAVLALTALLIAASVHLAVRVRASPGGDAGESDRLGVDAAALASSAATPRPDHPAQEANRDMDAKKTSAAQLGSAAAPSRSRDDAVVDRRTIASPGPSATTPVAANLAFDEANKLYDRRDYDEARSLALTLLRDHSTSARMRRIVVASSCIMGDQDIAQQHYLLLADRDRADMRQRCIPYGSNFHE